MVAVFGCRGREQHYADICGLRKKGTPRRREVRSVLHPSMDNWYSSRLNRFIVCANVSAFLCGKPPGTQIPLTNYDGNLNLHI